MPLEVLLANERLKRKSGFNGEISSSFITGSELATLVGLSTGTQQHNTIGWLSVTDNNRQLLIAKRALRYNIEPSHLVMQSLIDGSRIVTIKDKPYRVRVLSKDTEMGGSGSYVSDPVSAYGSEWNRIMYRLITATGQSGEGIPYGEWATYTQADLNLVGQENGSRSIVLATSTAAAANAVWRGGGSVLGFAFGTLSGAVNARGWRPVLELVE